MEELATQKHLRINAVDRATGAYGIAKTIPMPRSKKKWQQPAVEISAPTSIKPKFVDIEQAAVYFGVTEWTIRRQIKMGKLVAKKIGKRLVMKCANLDALWESEPAYTSKKAA